MQRIPSPSPSPANAYRSVSAGAPPSVNNVRGEDPAVTAASAAAERAEEDDVFLPLASDPPSPFTANLFNGTNPSSSSSSPAAQQQTHARKHSRIHERNLSAFFPRPGQAPGAGYGDTYDDPNGASPSTATASVRDMPSQVDEREAAAAASRAKAQGRRGHHHRHSLSHNFTSSPGGGGGGDESSYSDYSASPSSAAFSTPSFPVPSSLPLPSSHSRFSGLPSPLRFLAFIAVYLPLQTKAALGLATIQIALGATLWISGQSRESLAVTGLGYLVVFDGLAGVSRVLVEGAKGVENMWLMWAGGRVVDKGVRLPFGNQRLVTLSHFSQAIYLLFSAVYVCKESVEHVLLLHGGTEAEGAHGAGHGMGHGDSGGGGSSSGLDSGISLPVFFLALSALCSLISAIALSNHQGLSDAVGPSSFSRPRPRSSSPSLLDLVGNPYTLTVLTFSLGLASAHFVIPRAQLAPLDKVVALLESITMFYVAYPAAVATGQVLLQTSPSPSAAQMTTLTNGIRDIENHPLVLLVPPPHIWQLTPSPLSSSSPSSSSSNRRPKDPNTATLIATITIQVSPDASDSDLLQVTKFARERCALEGELTTSGKTELSHRFSNIPRSSTRFLREKILR
ncbi:hypothetical protein RQP46_003779 [Phenoliferia psychrophenolica]